MFRSCDHTDQPPTLVGGSAVDACYSPESSYGKFVPSVDFTDLRRERTDRQYHNSRLGPIHDDYKRLNHPRAPRERDDRVSKRDLPRHEHLRNQLSTQSSSYRSEPRSERWVPKKDSSSSRLFANAGALTSPAPSTSPQVPPSQVSHTPPPRPAREPMRLPALERLSPAESLTGSHDRRSALARISLPANKELNLPQREDGRSGSGYLHEDEQLLLEETTQDAPYGPGTSGITLPTSGSSPTFS
uniref:Uncharacterized protein n=2 Tax=Brassica oleracea TaxID=3712 RepID=A0A0D3C9P6_BRAOL|nr:unnamed protein product [Brassica oleracea]